MARMHSGKRGQSGSSRPYVDEVPEWVEMDEDEIVEKIVSLAKRGRTSSEIGVILRDQYGVPNVKLITEKDITEIMKEEGVYPDLPEDLVDLMEKAVNLKEHMEENPKDLNNKRGFQLVESKIRRLVKYYKEREVLPEDWKYSIEKAEMLTK